MKVAIELQGLVKDGIIEHGEVVFSRDLNTLERNGLIIKYETLLLDVVTIEVDFDADTTKTVNETV